MATDPLFINEAAPGGPPSYDANELRQLHALPFMYDGRAVGARQGVRPGGTQLQVTLVGSTITVAPGLFLIDPALTTTQGPYWAVVPTAENPTGGPLAAADATNPRKDIVIARVYDHDADTSGLRLARTEYIAGVAAPVPVEPAVPAGAFRLASIDVPQVGGGSPVVTDRRVWTVAAGGILPVSLAGDIAAGVEGRYRHRLDTGALEVDTGSIWLPVLPQVKRKTGSQGAPSSVLVDDAHLFFDLPANSWWIVEAVLFYQSPTAANFKVGWSGPASAEFNWMPHGIPAATDTQEGTVSFEWKGDIFGTYAYGGTEFCTASPQGILHVGGTAGMFRLRFAQSTDNASPAVLHPPSCLRLERIP